MRNLLILLSVLLIFSCKAKHKEDFSNINLTGTWKYEPTDNESKRENYRIIFSKDSSYYKFSTSNGGGLISQGLLSKNDSLVNKYNVKSKLTKIDSNLIRIEYQGGFYRDFSETYKRSRYQKKLNKLLKIDSIRTKIIGWWKLSKSRLPVKLINNSGEYNNLTMQIQDNGIASFYLENYLDSVIDYGYKIRENGIDFQKGCIMGGGTQLFIESDNVLRILMTKRSMDTIEFRKINKIQ